MVTVTDFLREIAAEEERRWRAAGAPEHLRPVEWHVWSTREWTVPDARLVRGGIRGGCQLRRGPTHDATAVADVVVAEEQPGVLNDARLFSLEVDDAIPHRLAMLVLDTWARFSVAGEDAAHEPPPDLIASVVGKRIQLIRDRDDFAHEAAEEIGAEVRRAVEDAGLRFVIHDANALGRAAMAAGVVAFDGTSHRDSRAGG